MKQRERNSRTSCTTTGLQHFQFFLPILHLRLHCMQPPFPPPLPPILLQPPSTAARAFPCIAQHHSLSSAPPCTAIAERSTHCIPHPIHHIAQQWKVSVDLLQASTRMNLAALGISVFSKQYDSGRKVYFSLIPYK